MYYFYDCNDVQQLYKDLDECIRYAKIDGTCAKVRDTQGGEYWISSYETRLNKESNQNPDNFKSNFNPY